MKEILIMIVLLSALTAIAQAQTMPATPTTGNITLTANPVSIPADGRSTSLITIVKVENPDMAGTTVAFGTINLEDRSALGTINYSVMLVNGTATAVLRAGTSPGVARVHAVYQGQNQSVGDVYITFTAAPGQPPGVTATYNQPGPITTSPGVTQTAVSTATVTSAGTATQTTEITGTPAANQTKPARTPGPGSLTALSMLVAVYLILTRKRKM